jgi:TolB-like protein
MKRFIALASVIFLGGSLAIAQPTTAPTASVAKVLIVPFKQMGDPSGHAWVGPAIQENLISDATGNPAVQPVSLNQPLANMDSADAVKAANDAGASIVVFGSYQVAADQLRVTGQATDVGSGRVLATLQVTGPITDLFKIEDALGAQLSTALPQSATNLAQVSYGLNAAGPAATAAPAPTDTAASVAAPQTYSYTPQPYVYPQTTYAYPSYDDGYPYYYPYYSPFFFGGFGGGFYGHGFIGARGGHFGGGHFGGGHFGGGHR